MLEKREGELEEKLFTIKNKFEFERIALEIFLFQYKNNRVYQRYVDFLGVELKKIGKIQQIPFLPIEFFKNNRVIHRDFKETIIFLSSGTTGQNQSKHLVAREDVYKRSFINTFKKFYGETKDYCFLALLPGYMEREGSSLIYMVEKLMEESNHPDNGFYLNEYDVLASKISKLNISGQKYIIIGVTYALLDFAKIHKIDLSGGIVMETGGMKGKRRELTKGEIHLHLKNSFSLDEIHSEYGMTELLSQAYSKGNGLFSTPNWMKVLIRDTYDPFSYLPAGKSGGINVIDLANLYSCSFIETKDLGRLNKNGQFEVLGRFDNSDIRGCNLLVT